MIDNKVQAIRYKVHPGSSMFLQVSDKTETIEASELLEVMPELAGMVDKPKSVLPKKHKTEDL